MVIEQKMDINEIRQKRLEYFNKSSKSMMFDNEILAQNDFNESSYAKEKNHHENDCVDSNNILSAYVNYNYNKKTSEYLNSKTTESNFRKDDDDDQNEFNSNYFRSNSFLSSATEENSYRDETEYKKKINEYKQIIEDSYLNHVINKKTEIQPLSNNDIDQLLNSYNKERKLSIDTLIVTNRSLSSSINSLSEFDGYKQQNSATKIGANDTITNDILIQPCTIQYMSAYNIYQPIEEHPLIQEQNNLDEKLKKLEINPYQPLLLKQQQQYDSESSSLSSPVQMKQVNETSVKKPNSPRVRLRLYQNNEESNKTAVGNTGNVSSNSQSSPSPNYIKHQVQPHPPLSAAPFSSSRSTTSAKTTARVQTGIKVPNGVSVHEVKPPSSRKVNVVPNYRKKLIKKVKSNPANSNTKVPVLVNNQFQSDSTNSEFNTDRTNDTNKDTDRLVSVNQYKPNQFNSNNKMVIPDLIQNCMDERNYQNNDNSKMLNNFFEKKSEQKINNENQNNSPNKSVFKQKSSSESRDTSDSEDTLNMISSHESFHKEIDAKDNDFKKFNLAINLGDLSGDDEDKSIKIGKTIPKIENYDINEEDDIMIMPNSSQFKQVKPSFIPNLMLCDPNDDDRSVSVAASLAVSMCNEIDYQKEMEKINDHILNNSKNVNNYSNSNNNNNGKNGELKQPLESNAFFLHSKPPQINQSLQQKKSTETAESKFHPKLVIGSEEPKKTVNINKISISPVLFNPAESFIKNIEKFQNNLPKSSTVKNSISENHKTEEKKKNFLWESADINSKSNTKLNLFAANRNRPIQRPSSALQNSLKDKILQGNENVIEKQEAKTSVLFDYKKLNEIEVNIDNAILNSQKSLINRPRSALENRQIDLKFDLPIVEVESSKNPIPQTVENEINIHSKNLLEQYYSKTSNEVIMEKKVENIDWLTLPQELWLNIMGYLNQKYLSQLGRVCKLFSQIYKDKTLWRSIILKNHHNVCDEWLSWIAERKPIELHIIQCSGNVTPITISEMFRTIGDSLHTLNLSSCFTGRLSADNVVLQASIRCRNVRSLDLSWTLLSNESLKLVVDSFKTIESINLSGCSMVKEDGINTMLIKHGQNLKNLELAGCFHLSSNVITNIGVYCRKLQRLNISNCHRVMNQIIIETSPSWTMLQFLDLRGIKNIKNNCISQIVRKCAKLDGLALANCIHLTDTTVLEIATYKPNFKYIDLKGCKKVTDNAIESMSNLFLELEFLDISATSITDTGLKALCNSKCSKNLEDLNLSFLPITEIALKKLIKEAINLKRLHLYGCYNLKKINDIKNFVINEKRSNLTISY